MFVLAKRDRQDGQPPWFGSDDSPWREILTSERSARAGLLGAQASSPGAKTPKQVRIRSEAEAGFGSWRVGFWGFWGGGGGGGERVLGFGGGEDGGKICSLEAWPASCKSYPTGFTGQSQAKGDEREEMIAEAPNSNLLRVAAL